MLAGVVSYYASSEPDGLTKVSEDKGFAGTETDHGGRTARWRATPPRTSTTSGSPAASPVSSESLVVPRSGTGLAYVVRRRGRRDATEPEHEPVG